MSDLFATWETGQPHTDVGRLGKWQQLQSQVKEPVLTNDFLSELKKLNPKDTENYLYSINTLVNSSINYKNESGKENPWRTPMQTLSSKEGDCKDYAFVKYWALKAAGVPDDAVRIALVRDIESHDWHMVVTVRQKDDILIMDNRSNEVLPAKKLYHYIPIYEFNKNKWYSYGKRQSKDSVK